MPYVMIATLILLLLVAGRVTLQGRRSKEGNPPGTEGNPPGVDMLQQVIDAVLYSRDHETQVKYVIDLCADIVEWDHDPGTVSFLLRLTETLVEIM